ncbi:Uncharacterised protein [Bacteroides finegoldii]|mgnify:FL=1|uniref:Uncharacterized protein n=1 Tax=Bacteroides finegoldii TaxID=338188 RepID=A0A174GUW2_9BACE|nr:Uncharacterised protein [Bacteroides finegoldii]
MLNSIRFPTDVLNNFSLSIYFLALINPDCKSTQSMQSSFSLAYNHFPQFHGTTYYNLFGHMD